MKCEIKDVRIAGEDVLFRICFRAEGDEKCSRYPLEFPYAHISYGRLKDGTPPTDQKLDGVWYITDNIACLADFDNFINEIEQAADIKISKKDKKSIKISLVGEEKDKKEEKKLNAKARKYINWGVRGGLLLSFLILTLGTDVVSRFLGYDVIEKLGLWWNG